MNKIGLFTPPESMSSCCDTAATPAGPSVTPPLHWLRLHTPPSERVLRCRIVAFRPQWLLSACCAGECFWEQGGCDWARPPSSALARPLRSASGGPFCPPVQYLPWPSRNPEGPSTLSHSNEPRWDKMAGNSGTHLLRVFLKYSWKE